MTHFLDDQGNIAKEMRKEGREHASFLALIVDYATKDYPPPVNATEIRCMNKTCTGLIEIEVDFENESIEWWCDKCAEAGRISDWQQTKWDNRK